MKQQDGDRLPPQPMRAPFSRDSLLGVSGGEITFAFMMVDSFSMIAFASAVEPLRLANRMIGQDVYRWLVLTADGQAVQASNGISFPSDGTYDLAVGATAAVVCAGLSAEQAETRELMAKLRGFAARGIALGAICTGTYILARAGLLEGHRCTIHWENLDSLREEFDTLDATSEIFEVDRRRFTCAGGTASIDLMLSIISCQHGSEIASLVIDQLVHHRMRDSHEKQRMELRTRLGVAHPKLLAVVERMEESIEEPVSCAALARSVDLTPRQVERLFERYLGQPPNRFYLGIRLDRARHLLHQTSLSIVSVGLACGFVSASHFSKCYSDRFSLTPSRERRMHRGVAPIPCPK